MKTILFVPLLVILLTAGFNETRDTGPEEWTPGSFGHDLAFLEEHTNVLVLSDAGSEPNAAGARIAIVPEMQGRVMTSTVDGPDGLSLGWINRNLIASGDTLPHINPYGGEDRFWLGPEGGQFSVFFEAGDPFDLEHWQTPAAVDTEPFDLVASTDAEASFGKTIQLENYSGTEFTVAVERTIRLVDRERVGELLEVSLDDAVQTVAFESENTIGNAGEAAWKPETGLLSIWILGMFNPSPSTTVVIPFQEGSEEELGPVVNDAYFGTVPEDRLVVGEGVLFFRGDGKYRSKIGLTPERAKPILGSYDAANEVLTVVQYTKPPDESRYVNSMWEIQDEPYSGDAVNSYNDGPPSPGAEPLGPFYELETSSPAAALAPGEELTHIHRTFHFQGPPAALDAIARATLGVSLAEIGDAL